MKTDILNNDPDSQDIGNSKINQVNNEEKLTFSKYTLTI